MKRREFIKSGVVSGATTLLAAHSGFALDRKRPPVLVYVQLSGGADPLTVIPPLEDPYYAPLRKSIALSAKGGTKLKLESPFYLHPRASELYPLWKEKSLAFVTQVGVPVPYRSHFLTQDALQMGHVVSPSLARDGFLARAVPRLKLEQSIRAVAIDVKTPLSLRGNLAGVLAYQSLKDFVLSPVAGLDAATFASLYGDRKDSLGETLREALSVQRELAPLRASAKYPRFLAAFPKHAFGQKMAEIGWLITQGPDIPVFTADFGGWDTHVTQGAESGMAAGLISQLSTGLAALRKQLGRHWERTVVVVMSEFGRSVAENGGRGSDHGYGGFSIVAGGPVRGGRIYGSWKELKKGNLFDERDLPVTTDWRQVLAECLSKQLKVPGAGEVFPEFSYDPGKNLGFLA